MGARGLGSMCRRLSKQSNKQHSELDLFFPIFTVLYFPSSVSVFIFYLCYVRTVLAAVAVVVGIWQLPTKYLLNC